MKKLILKALNLVAPHSGAWGSILMYHSVGENAAEFTVSLREFKKQMTYLVKHSYRVVKLSDLIQMLKSGQSLTRVVAITLDDGYADNYENVFPILKKFSIPASVFVTTALIGKDSKDRKGKPMPMLSAEQIREMHASGLVEFLPHGEHHKKLHQLPPEESRAEIMNSMQELEKLVGPVPRIFAYPSGRYSPETLEILKKEGFEAAVTVRPGLVRKGSPPFELPRNHMDSHTSFTEFIARLSPAGEWYERLKGKKV